ncbi:MAG: glycosyltransferase family 2 protein [Acidobacteriota bacterium]|nr:glycosyltransferase family 2 protein [Acidobacteriota bacterium]
MTVGLVVVTYNAEGFIRRTLDAVAAQTRPPDEIAIVDNASTDGTWAMLEHATRAWVMPVCLVAAGENLGFAAANNRAVARLEACELVALLNPDAVPAPGWLAALVAAAEAHPEAAAFASRLMIDGRPGLLDGAGDVCHVSGLVWRHGHGLPLTAVPDATRSRPVFAACAAAALYRRPDWVRAGGLDERFFCYGEDVDLGFRLQLAGRGCWYVADAVADHVGSASAGVGSDFAVYHGHRNVEWLFVKNMPAALLWRYLPLHLLVWVVGMAWFATRGRGTSFMKAKWDALKGMGMAWRARRTVQASRVRANAQVLGLLDRTSLVTRFRDRRT